MKPFSTSALILSVVLVIVIVAGLVFAFQASGKISTNKDAIAALQKRVATNEATELSDIAALKTQIGALQSQVTANEGKLTTAQTQLTAAQSKVTAHTDQLATLQGQLTALQGQVTPIQAQISSINDQMATQTASVASVQSQLSSLSSSISSLQSQISTLQGSGGTGSITNPGTVQVGLNTYALVTTFTSSVAGTLYVTGSSTSVSGYVYVYNATYLTTSSRYAFATSTTVQIPVSAGTNYLYFGNTDTTGTPPIYGYFTSIYRY
jgi:septal ring factor EnvC (AmiA/AmiB activator)